MHSHLLHYVIKLNGPGPNTALGYSHFYSPSPLIPLTLLVSFRHLATATTTATAAAASCPPTALHCREPSSRWSLAMSIDFTTMTGEKLSTASAGNLSSWPRPPETWLSMYFSRTVGKKVANGNARGNNNCEASDKCTTFVASCVAEAVYVCQIKRSLRVQCFKSMYDMRLYVS